MMVEVDAGIVDMVETMRSRLSPTKDMSFKDALSHFVATGVAAVMVENAKAEGIL